MNLKKTEIFMPELTVDRAVSRIQQKMDQSRQSPPSTIDISMADLRQAIRQAYDLGKVGDEVTPMEFCPAPLRPFARMAGKIVLVLAKFITDRQRRYNMKTTDILSRLTVLLADLHQEKQDLVRLHAEQGREIAILQAELARLQSVLSSKDRNTILPGTDN